MDVSIRLDKVGDWWRFTGIYGEPEFWKFLYQLHHHSVRLWLYTGDFNEILAHSKKEGDPMQAEWKIRNLGFKYSHNLGFKIRMEECGLHNLGFKYSHGVITEHDWF